jgi:type II secretory pathway component PulF
MAWYYFKGKNALGHTVQGQYQVDNEFVLTARLKSFGVMPVVVRKMSAWRALYLQIKQKIFYFFPIPRMYLSVFYYQLAGMLAIDISIKNALLVMTNHLSHPRFIGVINDMLDHLNKGHSLAYSMSRHPSVFSPERVRLIHLAQTKEELIAVLRYCDQGLQQFSFFRKIIYLIIPQLAIMAAIFACLLFMRIHYLPDFQYSIYVFGNPEPYVISLFTVLTNLLASHVLLNIAVIFALCCVLRFVFSRLSFLRYYYHAFLLCLPVVRGLILVKERERLALLYSVLTKDGLTLQKCAQYAGDIVVNSYFQKRVREMAREISVGESFPETLKRLGIFSSAELQLLSLGIVSHSIAESFHRVYGIAQMALEKKLVLLTEFSRLSMYAINVSLFLFSAYVLEVLFFYPHPAF